MLNGESEAYDFAMLQDRVLMRQGKSKSMVRGSCSIKQQAHNTMKPP